MERPSLYQRRVLDFVRSGTGNAVVRATAGAGKTSTLVHVAETLPRDLRTCFLAFGKDARSELQNRLPKHVEAKTTHSLGLATLKSALGGRGVRPKMEERKYGVLQRQALATLSWLRSSKYEKDVASEYLAQLVRFARLNYVDTKDADAVRALAVRYNLVPPQDLSLETQLHEQLRWLLKAGVREALQTGVIDFIDMIYIPEVLKLPVPEYDFVCVDEAQDYSAVALNFTMRLVNPEHGGRLLFVGDPRQSIYGFAGADTDALDRIITRTNATILPLSITYRCPRSHVELTKCIAPEIEARPDAPRGNIYWIHDKALPKWVREGDLILCRYNGPLIGACLRLVRDGKRAFVRGRELAGQLTRMSRAAFKDGFYRWTEALKGFEDAEVKRLRQSLAGRPQQEAVVADRRDLIEGLNFLVQDLARDMPPTQSALEERINETFSEEESTAVILSTVHRAKGREANRVLILYPELMPAGYAKTREAVLGEECVQFVALTRARRDLVFVELPPRDDWKPSERALRGV